MFNLVFIKIYKKKTFLNLLRVKATYGIHHEDPI